MHRPLLSLVALFALVTFYVSITQQAPVADTLGALLQPTLKANFTLSADQLPACYANRLQVNIFNESLPFATVVEKYYTAFPEKNKTESSLRHLLSSTGDIINRCLKHSSTSMRFDFTSLSDLDWNDFFGGGCLLKD